MGVFSNMMGVLMGRAGHREEARGWDVLRGLDFAHDGTKFTASTQEQALRVVPVYAATSLIADQFAVLPWAVYEFNDGQRRRLTPQPELMWNPHPHPQFTAIEWKHQFASSFLLRGNAYGVITDLDSQGRPSKIVWLHPDGMRVDESRRNSPEVQYEYNGIPLDSSTLIHIPWYPPPGSLVGLSPIAQFRQTIETGGSSTAYGSNWFRTGARPSGHLKYGAGPLDSEATAVAKARFKAAVANNDIFVTGNDWDWTALSIAPGDAQFIETTELTANQMAAIFRVSPEDIGGARSGSLKYETLELNQINFQIRTLMPLYARLEAHVNRFLPDYQYMKFNPDAVVRADLMSRTQAEEIQLRSFIRTNEEVRALEELPALTPEQMKQAMLLYGKAPAPTNPGGVTQPPKGGA